MTTGKKKMTMKTVAKKKTVTKKTVTKKVVAKKASGAKTGAEHRKEGDKHFQGTHQDLARAFACYSAAMKMGDDAATQNISYMLEQYEAFRDPVERERILVAMAAKGRPWAKRDLERLASSRDREGLRPTRIAMGDAAKIHELCARFDLVAIEARLRAVARPSVLLLSGTAKGKPRSRVTKMGGAPDVAADFEWPVRGGRRLTFLAQVNLEDIKTVVESAAMPKKGLLSFFHATPWDVSTERDGWAVIFTPDTSNLTPAKAPRAARGSKATQSTVLAASRELTLPFMRTEDARGLGLDEEGWKRYAALYYEHQGSYCLSPPEGGGVHRFGGHPDAIQGDMTRRIEYGRRGKDVDVPDAEIDRAAKEWRLLLQVSSDENLGLGFGDNGRMFFWIRATDLAQRAFEKVVVEVQSH